MITRNRITSLVAAAIAAAPVLTPAPAGAGTMTASQTAPEVNGDDIANFGEVTGTDKWFAENSAVGAAKGQTFRTGTGAVRLRSVTYQISDTQKAAPTKTYVVRVGTVSGSTFTQVYSETFTQGITWNSSEFMSWTFTNPPLLSGNTTYAVDIGMTNSTSSWQTGIPYIHVTASEYTAGQLYSSGTSGVGTATMGFSVNSDRIFHLDLEPPHEPTLQFAAGNPPDDSPGALIRPELVATFTQDLAPGTGNITIRNLTDAADTRIPVNDPRISISANLLKIATSGLIDWSKSYAILIEPGAIQNGSGTPFAGITSDTTWNFTTAAGDPLLVAIAALKNHITGTALLNATDLANHSQTMALEADRFADSATTIGAVLDLIATYDNVKGPLWVPPASTSLTRSAETNDLTWTIYRTMQSIMDRIYNGPTLAAHESLLDGFKFGSSARFPGTCPPPANPAQSHTVPVNGSFPDTFGRHTQGWTAPARKPTGCYLAPGTIATVTVPASIVGQGYKIRVGANSWDLSKRPSVPRLDRSTVLYAIDATTTKVASPLGGGIYLEVPFLADGGVFDVTVTGAVRSPYFSAKDFHTTTLLEWLETERNHVAPWADFQTDKFMMQVPRSWISSLADPVTLMADWDLAMDAMNDLMGFPRLRGKETMYLQPDLILRSSVHAPGYPAVNVTYSPTGSYGGYANNHLVRGPRTGWDVEFHEQGHAYFFPKFGGETESNVNLLHAAVWHRKFDYSLDESFRKSLGYGSPFVTLDTTAIAWMTVFNFAPRRAPMATAEKAYQLKGHAKFVDIVRLYGWSGLDAYWLSFNQDEANGIPIPDDDGKLLRLSKSIGKDIRPLFHFWGIFPKNPSTLAASIAAEGLQAPVEIYDLLVHYKSLIPTNNAAFRDFTFNWWGKQPSINGYWEQREHARQWDTTALYGAGDQQRSEATNPGEIYNENSAADIQNRVEELLDLYYPGGRPGSDYETWNGVYFPADLSDPDADLDGDGLSNNDERVFGLDPTNGSSTNPITIPLDSAAGTFTYTRRDDALTSLVFEVWTSSNLEAWSKDSGAVQSSGPVDANGVESVGVTLSPGLLDQHRLFVQIRAAE